MKVVSAEGTHQKVGYSLGCQLEEAIKHNVELRKQDVRARGMGEGERSRLIREFEALSSPSSLSLMEGMSIGCGLSLESVLEFNALQDILSPEGCTTFAAVGKATPDGNAIILKNRDKGGNLNFTGPGHYQYKEINVTVALKTDDGNVMVGVTAAGSAGIAMGLNRYGVAAAINFGQSREISHLSSQEMYGISGRPQMLREGLECTTAKEAATRALRRLAEKPMGTPGILWFVDAQNIYVIEGSFQQFALQHVTDGAVYRSNHFLLLDHLNNEKAVSSICRKIRAAELVEENFGKIDRETLMAFSTDHKNGPYENSICRHSKNPEGAITVSAAIMEPKGGNPEKSRISIALGTPCWAWNHEKGNISFRMDQDIASISQPYLDGSVYKEFIKAEPFKD